MTTVGANCQRDVVTVTSQATVAEAARLMRDKHVGCVVVVDDQRSGPHIPLGIVTDRDIVVEVIAVGLDPQTMTVGDIMPRQLVTVRVDQDTRDALRFMHAQGIRRLPVVGDGGRLLGLIAFDDLLESVNDQLWDLTKAVSREQLHEAVARK